jgi:hypothetical protein
VDSPDELGPLIRDWFLDVSNEPGFWSGVLVGVVGFAVIAFAVFTVRVWWGAVTEPYRPQSITHVTSATPAQITYRSFRALVLGLLIFACVFCTLVEMLWPGTLQEILQALGLWI